VLKSTQAAAFPPARQFTIRSPALSRVQATAVLNNLGVFYTNERRFEEAERAHQRALAIRKNAKPPLRADVAQSQCNLAVMYHSHLDFTRAEELYRESIQTLETIEQPSEDYEIAVANYADLLRSLGKNRKAASIEARARKRRARG
jgi:tetratricopeptide (TPR) repeat protein